MQYIRDLLFKCTGFQRDTGNSEKNWISHKVEMKEAEEVMRNLPIALSDDRKHSSKEPRYDALGRTNANRLLFVVFTIRGDKVRVISARDMNLEEQQEYYEEAA